MDGLNDNARLDPEARLLGDPVFGPAFMDQLVRLAKPIQPIYPLFHASTIKAALLAAIPTADGMIVDVSEIKTVGDCRYAITTRDHAGQTYRITVQVESERGQ